MSSDSFKNIIYAFINHMYKKDLALNNIRGLTCHKTQPRRHHHHHHHVVLVARISLTLSRHFSLSFIASGRSSGLHLVSSHCCWMYVRAGRPAFARPCVGAHKSTSLMRSSLLLRQMSGSSNLNSFRDRRQVAVQLVSCGMLPPGLVQDCSQHSCVIAV